MRAKKRAKGKSTESRCSKKKQGARPAWMHYVKDSHEAVMFAKIAGQLGVSVPEMMRTATVRLINEALSDYVNSQKGEQDEQRDSGSDEQGHRQVESEHATSGETSGRTDGESSGDGNGAS